MCVHMDMEGRYQPWMSFLRELFTLSLRQGASLFDLELASGGNGQMATPPESSCCLLPSTGMVSTHTKTCILCGF